MNSLAQLKVGECDCFHISLRFLMRLWAAVRRLNYFHCIVSLSNLLLVCFAGLLFLSRVCDHCCFDFLCSRLFSSWQTHSSPFTEMLMCAPKMSLKDNQGLRHAEANQLFGKIKINQWRVYRCYWSMSVTSVSPQCCWDFKLYIQDDALIVLHVCKLT